MTGVVGGFAAGRWTATAAFGGEEDQTLENASRRSAAPFGKSVTDLPLMRASSGVPVVAP
jgi:hypothetical protein